MDSFYEMKLKYNALGIKVGDNVLLKNGFVSQTVCQKGIVSKETKTQFIVDCQNSSFSGYYWKKDLQAVHCNAKKNKYVIGKSEE